MTTRSKGKEIMTEPEKPSKKKAQELLSEQEARRLEEEFAQEDQSIRDQIEKDAEIARAQAEDHLIQMISVLDRSNEVVNNHLQKYEDAVDTLTIEEKIELISELLKYQKDLAQIKRYQAQQQKLHTKPERKKFYMAVLRTEFIPVWERAQNFIPMESKEEREKFKRPGVQLEQRSSKRIKSTAKSSKSDPIDDDIPSGYGLTGEELKGMIELVHIDKVYVEALQVKRPIIGWYVQDDGRMKSWKIVRVGEHVELYQTFEDMLKGIDKDDLDKLWSLAQEVHVQG
ncbi:hypothetical protein Tco_0938182 [Tanacetum coccineum]|uniref:Uncharacterized protein n=1 Tax=Tanacetum coccineum TaxID=301880 RepID=A0ABQ5DHC5_9ASTR